MMRWGVTSVQQMENDRDAGETLAALAEADIPLRWGLFEWPMPARSLGEPRPPIVRPAALPARVRLLGTKWMLDGTPVERGAALRAPYADRPAWSGRLNFTPDELRTILRAALADSGQTALHVAGDSTLALVLRTMTELAPPAAWRTRRLRIEHGDGTMADLLPTMRDLGVVLVQNPLHLATPQFLHARYGPERTPRVQLLRSALAAGIPLALGADAGGSGRNPWLNLMLATLHPSNPAEALTREQALVAYTRGSAYAERQEHEKGSLAPGMLADLAVLSQNVLEVPPEAIPATESVLTMIGGVIVHRAGGAAAAPPP
jgi:predicted amidohydrolase YtcJ